jgi:hypothetical protein
MKKLMKRPSTLREFLYTTLFCTILGALLIFLGFIGMLLFVSTKRAGGISVMVNNTMCWFDPVLLQYNLILLLVGVLFVPLMTIFYIYSMKDEKLRRLRTEIPENKWKSCKTEVQSRVESLFKIRHYIGSLSALTIVILLGMSIILLLKPTPESGGGCGVDYSIGANFLMLGPFMAEYIEGGDHIKVIVATLTGFQFGFLGAYIYFIGHFVRSYFSLDLTPNTFVICCVRIVTGSILGLVLSFYLHEILQTQRGILPIIAFFIGFFPSRGLLAIEKISMSLLKLASQEYTSTPLSQLPGMSYAHEVRLDREGFDNIENLTEADPLELTLRTGFSYGQLKTWISQARLAIHLGADYHLFYKATGIESISSLNKFLQNWQPSTSSATPSDALNEATGNRIAGKITTLCTLECKSIQQQAESQGETS